MTPASRALLYGEDEDDDTPLTPEEMADFSAENGSDRTSSGRWVTLLLAFIVATIVGAVGWLRWRAIEPNVRQGAPQEVNTPAEVEEN